MRSEIVQEFRFHAGHFLPAVPEGHACRRIHGHSYRVEVHVTGPILEEEGWVLDFHDLEAAVQPVIDRLDHRLLNEVEGLPNPTAERIGVWIWERLAPRLPGLTEIVVWETDTARAMVRG
ncbi:MAG: 6-carboxytetrahydropterin synthase QueD [Pseudomonadota bacterium]